MAQNRGSRPLMITIIGSFVSPYVRKVLACLNLKGLAYEIDPITSFFAQRRFRTAQSAAAHPRPDRRRCDAVRFVGDLRVHRRGLSRSPRCCRPTPGIAPASAGSRNMPTPGSATSSSGACSIRRSSTRWCGASRAIRPASQKTLSEDLPVALDYLETELPPAGFLFGEIGIADISIATFFRNGSYAGFEADPQRWPRTAAFVERALAHPAFATLLRSRTCSAASRSSAAARPSWKRAYP